MPAGPPARVQPADESDEEDGSPEREVDVFAREARVVEEGRREGQQAGEDQRRDAPELAAQQNGQDDQRGATDGGVHARGGNCRSEDEVDQGIAMELVRPVHHRVVVVLGARIASCDALPHVIFEALPQVPRIRGVQALVVVQGARAEIPEAHDGADKGERAVEDPLDGRDARADHLAGERLCCVNRRLDRELARRAGPPAWLHGLLRRHYSLAPCALPCRHPHAG